MITIQLNTGKLIELTIDEYEELYSKLKKMHGKSAFDDLFDRVERLEKTPSWPTITPLPYLVDPVIQPSWKKPEWTCSNNETVKG